MVAGSFGEKERARTLAAGENFMIMTAKGDVDMDMSHLIRSKQGLSSKRKSAELNS